MVLCCFVGFVLFVVVLFVVVFFVIFVVVVFCCFCLSVRIRSHEEIMIRGLDGG